MSQTAPPAPGLVVGRLLEQRDGEVVLGLPGTEYRLYLATAAPLGARVGERVRGVVSCRARRVDVFPSGGRYIEPGVGRPRWVQGRIAAVDPAANTLTVAAPVAVTATLTDPRQAAAQFAVGQLVGFSAERGAMFEPIPL